MSFLGEATPNLSLVAQFDDLCRRTAADDNEETMRTFLEFLRNQEMCRQQWDAAERCVTRFAEENTSLVQTNSELQEKLQYTRAVLKNEVEERLRCEAKAEALQLQLDEIRHCISSRSFRNRERHVIRMLKNILDDHGDSLANTTADKSSTADKSVQSMLLSPNSGPILLSGDGRSATSRGASREEQGPGNQWNLRVQSLPGTPSSGTGTRHPFCVRPVPAERSSLGSVSAGAGSAGVALAGPDPIEDASSGLGFARPVPGGGVSHGLDLRGPVPAGSGSVGFYFARPAPAGDSSVGHSLTRSVLAGPACAGAVSYGLGFAEPAPPGFVSNGLGFAEPFPAEAFSDGLSFGVPVSVGYGLAEAVPAAYSSKGAPVRPHSAGPWSGRVSALQSNPAGLRFGRPRPARPASFGHSSAGPLSAPAKVHFELSSSKKSGGKSSRETSSRATSGCIGNVFATTMTVVAGKPGYVATVASQMNSNARTLPNQQVQQSMMDESQVEQESGFFSRLVEHPGPQLSTSTPLDMSPPPPQQSHTFIHRPAVSSKACAACGRRIRFYKASLHCSTCHLICHPQCKNAVPVPCTPRVPIEQARVMSEAGKVGGSSKGGAVLSDYTLSKPPPVPPLVIHCIQEVERRCAMEKGPLYGSTVTAAEVDSLLGQLLNRRSLSALDRYSLPVVCGALVTFLASLRERVVTKSVWLLLAKATENVDTKKRLQELLDAVLQLPAPNRATLTTLLAHLHHVSATSLGEDGRSLDELSTVFAPLVVGCSESNPSAEAEKRDKPLQELIMHCLLSVPEVYWTDCTATVGNEAEG